MITEYEIECLLRKRHRDDIFVRQCKDGQTHGRSHARIDAIVIPRSYRPFTIIGYEIKCSRGDYVSDNKWPRYLEICNQLYFVVSAPKIIHRDEIPETAGLIEVRGKTLRTVKKAPRREIEVPIDMLLYLLISRAAFDVPTAPSRDDRADFWRRWYASNKSLQTLGYHVSRRIARINTENIDRIRQLECQIVGMESDLRNAERGVTTQENYKTVEQLSKLLKQASGLVHLLQKE